ncbi:MAG: MFS family permease [Planctomycetota bacterium]|jgi:MFS family permease
MKGYLHFLRAEPRFLAFGFALTFFSSFGQTFFIALFGEEFRESFELSHTDYGTTYSVATLCSGMTIIYVGRKIDHVDLRKFTLWLCVGLMLACALLAGAVHVAMLAAAFFLLRLCGQGLLGHTALTSMSRYFHENRGKALSIAGLGYAAGEAILPSIAVAAIAMAGWRQAWIGAGACVAFLLIPGVLFLLRGHAERHTRHLEHTEKNASARNRVGKQWTVREVLRSFRFYGYLPAVMAPGFIMTGIFFHQGQLIESKGWDKSWFAACFMAFAAAQVLTGLVAGPLVDRFGARNLLPLFLLPMACGVAVIGATSTPMTAVVFLSLFGATGGLGGPIVGGMWAEEFGTQHLGSIRAMTTSVMVFGTAGSPALFGKLLDSQVSIDDIAWMCCAYAVVGMALATVASRLRRT